MAAEAATVIAVPSPITKVEATPIQNSPWPPTPSAFEIASRDHSSSAMCGAYGCTSDTAVSAANDCFFCMDSHAAHASAVGELHGEIAQLHLLEDLKTGSSEASLVFKPATSDALNLGKEPDAETSQAPT